MKRQAQVEKREKSLLELLMVLLLVVMLMASFLYYYLKQQPQVSSIGFNALSHRFSAKLTAVHAQWLMEGKPDVIRLRHLSLATTSVSGQQVTFQQVLPVNKHGWIDVQGRQENNFSRCETIWQLVMEMPMEFLKSPIVSLELRKSVPEEASEQTQQQLPRPEIQEIPTITKSKISGICRYSLSVSQYFQYHSNNGKVETQVGF